MSLSIRVRIILIVVLTLLATLLGVWNLSERMLWNNPTDGFFWTLTVNGLQAVLALDDYGIPTQIRVGDILTEIDGHPVTSERDYYETIYGLGVGASVQYGILRTDDNARVSIPVVIGKMPVLSASDFYTAFLGFTYLIIGVILGLRHWRSPGAQHFYAVCILSYILYLFAYTGEVSILDLIIYWSSSFALLLLPPVFVHFCLTFPEQQPWVSKRPKLIPLLYAPFVLLIVTHILWAMGRLAALGLPVGPAGIETNDKIHIAFFALYFLLGAMILATRFVQESDVYLKQQLKWVSIGTLLGILPFLVVYVFPYILGVVPNGYMEASSLFLVLIPLSFSHAVVRYKLMDVDIIFKRGLTYAIAGTLTLVGYFLLVIGGNKILSRLLPEGGSLAIGAAALTIAFLFAPLRNKIQGLLDRAFYREKFDYRDSLMEFSRALTTEISLDRLVNQILARIESTFAVEGIGLLLAIPGTQYQFQVVQSKNLQNLTPHDKLKLVPPSSTVELNNSESFPHEPLGGLEQLQQNGVLLVQPFSSRGRVVGLLVLGSPKRSGFFTSEDIKLLQVLGGYAAIALENAGLYHSLEVEAYQLEELKVFNENIIESINVGMVSIDLDGIVTACNGAFEKLYDMARTDVIGSQIDKILSTDVIRAIQTCTGKTDWVINRAISLYKHYLDTRKGRALIVNLSVIPLHDRRDTLTGSLLVLDDITEKVQLEDQLFQAKKLSSIGLLAAGIAHEVNTPIAGISSYTQILLKEMPSNDPRREVLSKIEKQTFRASEIVNNLLNFARMSESTHDSLDINHLIRNSISLLEHQLQNNQIEVLADLQDNLPQTYGNSNKLQQVLVNLMLNAKDSMPSGGKLEITTSKNNDNIIIDITDSGEGMTEEVMNHIYDPFYTTKGVSQGTGLGLAVSYGIMQEHSGRIFVESTPGVGTHFQLKLPAARVN